MRSGWYHHLPTNGTFQLLSLPAPAAHRNALKSGAPASLVNRKGFC
jgi:hypothetical protein